MGRPSLTLILVTRHAAARADFRGRGPVPGGRWEQHRPDAPDLASAVEYALALGPRPARRVWVLTTDAWVGTVAQPAHRVAGLKPAALATALGFEAESFSGIPALDAATAAVPLPRAGAEQPCWVVQARAADLDAVDEVVRRAGGSLAGLLHPAGLPRKLADTPGAAFERVELWPDAVAGVRVADGGSELRVWNTDPPLGRWQADVAAWARSDAADAETLTAEGFAEPKNRPGPVVRLTEPAGLDRWLAGWAAVLAGRRPAVPVVPAPVRPLSGPARAMVAALLAAVAAAGCYAHWLVLDRQREDFAARAAATQKKVDAGTAVTQKTTAQAADRDKLRAERAKLEDALAKLRKDRDAVRVEREGADRAAASLRQERKAAAAKFAALLEEDAATRAEELEAAAVGFDRKREAAALALERQRRRFAGLLGELARQKPDDLVIHKIEHRGDTLTVRGVSLQADSANRYASALAPVLGRAGWAVLPAETKKRPREDDAELHDFSIAVRDTRPAPPAAAPSAAARGE